MFHTESYSHVHCSCVHNSEYVVSAGCAFIGSQQVDLAIFSLPNMQQDYEKTNWKAKCISAWMGSCWSVALLSGAAEIFQPEISAFWKILCQLLEEWVTEGMYADICNKGYLRARNNSANCLQNIAKTDLCPVLLIERNLFNSFHGIFVHK